MPSAGDAAHTEGVITRAILGRRPLALEYRFPGQGLRTVHPHVLYRTIAGVLYVDTYQVDGYTSVGSALPGWRAFALSQIVRVEPLEGRFTPAPGYNAEASKYRGGIVASA